jgi:hypothetical protein
VGINSRLRRSTGEKRTVTKDIIIVIIIIIIIIRRRRTTTTTTTISNMRRSVESTQHIVVTCTFYGN